MRKSLGIILGVLLAVAGAEAQSIHLDPSASFGRIDASLIKGVKLSGTVKIEDLKASTGKEKTDVSFDIDIDVKRDSNISMKVRRFGEESQKPGAPAPTPLPDEQSN